MATTFDFTKTALSLRQREFYEQLQARLPFVADIARAGLVALAPAKEKDFFLTVVSVSPGTVANASPPTVQETYTVAEIPEAAAAFHSGRVVSVISETGLAEKFYPLRDGRGDCIGVVKLVFPLMPDGDHEHLLWGAQQVLAYGHSAKIPPAAYRRLTMDDGVIVADPYGRILFADEIARHIYRRLGHGSLIGRSLFDEHLRQSVERETVAKDSPGELELSAMGRIFRERKLCLMTGGETKAHICLITDITAERKQAEEAKIQAALSQRIEALEKEISGLRDSLETRKLLDRAKGILMETHHYTEMESYCRIQRYAMMKRLTMKEVAEAIIKAAKK